MYAILYFFPPNRSLIVHCGILSGCRKLNEKKIMPHIVFAADKLETFIIYAVRTKYLYCKHLGAGPVFPLTLTQSALAVSFSRFFFEWQKY